MSIDVMFADKATRDVEYNARASVDNFDHYMAEYALLAKQAKQQVAGIYNLYYGMGRDERLDIFPSLQQPAALFIYIHGGYWRALSKDDACSMAVSFPFQGVAVSCIEYTLAPEATLAEIVREVRSAVAWLYHHASHYGIDKNRIYVGGSSAGGHLAAMLIADTWQDKFRVPLDVIKGAMIFSGLFDLRPLCDTHINAWLKLTEDESTRLSPLFHIPEASPASHTPQVLLTVGALETLGFKNQTDVYYQACLDKGLKVKMLNDSQSNHFNIVNSLANPQSEIFKAVLTMIQNDTAS